jgi:acyl-CoA ligase (AMP-forming) (exosortase A-associated)
MTDLVHELIFNSALRTPDAEALVYQSRRLNYAALSSYVEAAADTFLSLGLNQNERVAIYLDKRIETVVALFAATAAGGVMVPVNPLLKQDQVAYLLADCNAKILVTSAERLYFLKDVLTQCKDLHTVLVVGSSEGLPPIPDLRIVQWSDAPTAAKMPSTSIDSDMAAILYTSGSTGKPKGVVLSHRNIVLGAKSVAQYLENQPGDRILSVLPLSFDYGLNQLTTAFHVGACSVLMNYLLPQDVAAAVKDERITGLAAVPPLWNQLAHQSWPDATSLRYITNSGGAMPRTTLDLLSKALPTARVFLMYGLTEAFRSTYLPPSEVDARPDSIGKAIPNAEVMVVRSDGSPCAPDEPGELVHLGPLVALGYWNDPEKTAERFRPAPRYPMGLMPSEIAVWSGDTVRMDDEGFLYFIGRYDDMIKVSGYRVSPTEVEEVISASANVTEVVAVGVPHPTLGQAIAVVAVSSDISLVPEKLIKECRRQLPAYMVPSHIEIRHESLPRNPNGKFDRKALQQSLSGLFDGKIKT